MFSTEIFCHTMCTHVYSNKKPARKFKKKEHKKNERRVV